MSFLRSLRGSLLLYHKLNPWILTGCCSSSVSKLHVCARVAAGEKWRISHGLSRSGTEYGPLTDLPDWSYADGRAAPTPMGKKKRQRGQLKITRRIKMLMQQVDGVVLNQVREEYGLEDSGESSSQEKPELEPKPAYDTKKILDTHHRK